MAARKPKTIPEFADADSVSEINGETLIEWRNARGRLDRANAPAQLLYDNSGRLLRETYFADGLLHREDGPAHVVYDRRGRVKTKEFWVDNRLCETDSLFLIAAATRDSVERIEF